MQNSISICIGYIGMSLHYHTIYFSTPSKVVQESIIQKKFQPIQPKVIMLSPRRKFFKIHKTKKVSKNYEGQGKNKK